MNDYGSLKYFPNEHNKLFANPKFIRQLISDIKVKLGRQIMINEREHILNILQNINPVKFNNIPIDKILKILTDTIVEQLAKVKCDGDEDQINIHELLKAEIGVAGESGNTDNIKSTNSFTSQITSSFSNQVDIISLFGNKSLTDLQRLVNPELVKTHSYIMLDTRYRSLDNDGTEYFKWNFINNEIISQGTVNALGNIGDIISMRIFPIRIPYASQADNNYSRVSLYIQEFSSQSFIAQENKRFHWLFKPVVNGRYIELKTDTFNDGIYRFRQPITRLDTLTFTFGSPLDTIFFDNDRLLTLINSYANPIVFTTNVPHQLETGDIVITSGFTTTNPISDSTLISSINTTSGNIAIVISNTSFSIDVNATSIRAQGAGTITVVNGSTQVVGIGTNFSSVLIANDYIEILGSKYSVVSIQSNLQLTISPAYGSTGAAGLVYYKNNILSSLGVTSYFTSKRMFIPIEIEYYNGNATN